MLNAKPRVMLNPSCQFGNIVLNENGEEVYNEALVMYDIALRAGEMLRIDGRVEPFLSRPGREERSNLREETELTKSLGCDVLVAIHSDADPDGGLGGGTWMFYADEVEGRRLAELIHSNLLTTLKTFYPEVEDRGVRTHWKRLWVLHESGCPACLTEVLFHSNPHERLMLINPYYQSQIAGAIANGVLEYFNFSPNTGTNTPPQTLE